MRCVSTVALAALLAAGCVSAPRARLPERSPSVRVVRAEVPVSVAPAVPLFEPLQTPLCEEYPSGGDDTALETWALACADALRMRDRLMRARIEALELLLDALRSDEEEGGAP